MQNAFDKRQWLVVAALGLWTASAGAADNPVGHASSLTKYKGVPPLGKQYKITIKADKNGNPASFPIPSNPAMSSGLVSVERGTGAMHDPLTAGTWTGLGKPPGTKGWKYRNKEAPTGGAVGTLVIGPRKISLTTKGTGTMTSPTAPNGAIETVIFAGGERFCAQASAPYYKEVDGEQIKSRDQTAPIACPSCTTGTDSDGDRLDDCYETRSGVYISPTDTGTDPLLADTDGDSISDGDEVLGSLAGLNLLALGASPVHMDILVEYDWFDDSNDCPAHTHQINATIADRVTAGFADAPLRNPDGTTGINFIHDYGQGGAFTGGNLISDADGVLSNGVNSAEYVAYKTANFAANRNGYFHYTILPHRYDTSSTSSGQAELPGDDMIVSLACNYHQYGVIANTIAHELGHNLYLRHGGFEDCNYKPNYGSVMNYRYQFFGADTNCNAAPDGILDYSRGVGIALNENSLNENNGVCGSGWIDWNGNLSIDTSLTFDINPLDVFQGSACGGTYTTLQDYDDWNNIDFSGLSEFDGAPVQPPEIIDCDNPMPMPQS